MKNFHIVTKIIIGVFVGFVGLIAFILITDSPTQTPGATAPSLDKSPEIQAARRAAIDTAIKLGVFTKVERNGTTLPRAWTGKTFNDIDFAAKQNALSVVYAFYFDGKQDFDSVAVIDGLTGKEIGRFTSNGLRLR